MIKLFDNLLKADKKNYAANTKGFLSLAMEVCSKETSTKHDTAETIIASIKLLDLFIIHPNKSIFFNLE